jgi:retron-type reverse transcriptase
MENLKLAHINARKGKLRYSEVQNVNQNPAMYLSGLRRMLLDKTYKTAPYKLMQVYEPKKRTIYKLPYYPDRIAHHAIMNVLQPIWDKTFIDDVYSAIPGRGLHAGLIRLRQFMRDEPGTQYCLKFDISKFYPSVDHEILLDLIWRKIKCKDTMWLLEEIIRSPGGNKNIPIGNYLSQYFAQIYLDPLDRWIKEENHMHYYIRYGDDGVILHSDRKFLKDLLTGIAGFMKEHLDLTINSKSRVFPADSAGIDFLGYRTFRDYSLLRSSAAKRFKKKIHFIEENHASMEPQTIVSVIMSYLGWIGFCNGYNLKRKYVTENDKILSILTQANEVLHAR